jgi:hypothetical protein
MPAEKIDFELPDYKIIRQNLIDSKLPGLEKTTMSQALEDDKQNDDELLKTKVFEDFFQQKNDSERKKILLVISGSYIEGEDHSQSYPNYLKEMAQSNYNCDFLVLNIDPKFATNLNPADIEIEKNVDLKFLKGHLNPVKNPQFYSEIGNNLHRFDKVVFCSHTCQVGALDFHPLHRHCQKQGTDCITIGAYFNESPCCIIKEPLIKQDHVFLDFFEKTHFFIDRDLIPKEGTKNGLLDSQKILKLSFVFKFLDIDFGSDKTDEDKKTIVEEKKVENQYKSIELFTGIEDEDFITAVTQFVQEKEVLPTPIDVSQNSPSTSDSKSKSDLESKELTTIFGLGTGAIVGLTCVSALGLGIVSAPAFAIVAGTTIAGATAFYLINQEIQKNNPQK